MYKKRSFVREVFISRDRTLSKIIYAPKIFSRLWLEKKEIQYNQNNKLITFQKSVKMAKEDENVIFRKKCIKLTFASIFCHLWSNYV